MRFKFLFLISAVLFTTTAGQAVQPACSADADQTGTVSLRPRGVQEPVEAGLREAVDHWRAALSEVIDVAVQLFNTEGEIDRQGETFRKKTDIWIKIQESMKPWLTKEMVECMGLEDDGREYPVVSAKGLVARKFVWAALEYLFDVEAQEIRESVRAPIKELEERMLEKRKEMEVVYEQKLRKWFGKSSLANLVQEKVLDFGVHISGFIESRAREDRAHALEGLKEILKQLRIEFPPQDEHSEQ